MHGCGRTPSPADDVGASPVLTATDGGSQHLRAGRRIRGGVAWYLINGKQAPQCGLWQGC